MGADAVYFYYGVRRTIPHGDEEQIGQLEDDSHPIYNLAFDHKLHVAWGCLTDGADYFLLLGNEIGRFGIEGIHEQSISESRFTEIVEKTKVRLNEAGITEPLHFMFSYKRNTDAHRQPNEPDPANPAMALQFHSRGQRRRVADLDVRHEAPFP